MERPLLSGYGAFEAVLSEAFSHAPNPTYILLTSRAVAHPAVNGGMRPRTYRRRKPSNTPRRRRDGCGAFHVLRRYRGC